MNTSCFRVRSTLLTLTLLGLPSLTSSQVDLKNLDPAIDYFSPLIRLYIRRGNEIGLEYLFQKIPFNKQDIYDSLIQVFLKRSLFNLFNIARADASLKIMGVSNNKSKKSNPSVLHNTGKSPNRRKSQKLSLDTHVVFLNGINLNPVYSVRINTIFWHILGSIQSLH